MHGHERRDDGDGGDDEVVEQQLRLVVAYLRWMGSGEDGKEQKHGPFDLLVGRGDGDDGYKFLSVSA